MSSKVEKVVVIGSGPAGWTAALYTARATLSPLVYEGSAPNLPGGQLMITSDVENFPGFPEGVMGPELMDSFKAQAERFGARVKTENITSVDFSSRPFKLTSETGDNIEAMTVIIATGANAKLIGIPRESELMSSGGGVSACATCDGAFYKDVDVAVVGGGDSAMEEAIFLTRFAKSVTIIHRREEFRASNIMVERARKNEKIKWELNQQVVEILTTKKPPMQQDNVWALRLENTQDKSTKEIAVEGLFVAIGHKPNISLFEGKLDLDAKGYLETLSNSSKTKIPGVFACGDVQDSYYRQAITAAGSGCMAAIDAERFLEHEGQ